MDRQIKHETPPAVDTIAAVSTPSGEGGIGIIRLSGPDAIAIAAPLFLRPNGRAFTQPRSHHQYYGWIHDPATGDIVDEVLLTVMLAPRSYTCEDVVEISGHGGPVPLRALLHLLCAQGARLAQPGEFTLRAFLNGRIDLTQAEAVLDTIRARTDAGLRAAQRHLCGEVARQIDALHTRLVTLLASLEAAIDYADEELTFFTSDEIRTALTGIGDQITQLVASQAQGRLLREGARTAIVGRPNTGKSSLLNALVGEARAIVTAIPGTTRDVIEEQIDLDGIPLCLLDTAGIRHTEDHVEQIGVARSRASIEEADLILLVLDRTAPLTSEDLALIVELQGRPVLALLNKSDLPCAFTAGDVGAFPAIEISALTGEGIPRLRQEIRDLLLGEVVTGELPQLANLRQREAAERAFAAVEQAVITLETGGSEELIAVDVMVAANALGEITGANIREDVITELFARFCVGK